MIFNPSMSLLMIYFLNLCHQWKISFLTTKPSSIFGQKLPPNQVCRFAVFLRLCADLSGYACPTSVTRSLKRPDLILVHRNENIVVVELTCGFITKVKENSERKQTSYNETLQDLHARYKNTTFVNLSMSALGLIGKNDSGQNLLT